MVNEGVLLPEGATNQLIYRIKWGNLNLRHNFGIVFTTWLATPGLDGITGQSV